MLQRAAVAMLSKARRGLRWTSAAMGRGATDSASVLNARTPATAPFPTPSERLISGASTANPYACRVSTTTSVPSTASG